MVIWVLYMIFKQSHYLQTWQIKYHKSSKLSKMNISVDNGDVNGDYFYMSISTWSVINNHNSIGYTNNRDEVSTNRYLRGNNGLTGGAV